MEVIVYKKGLVVISERDIKIVDSLSNGIAVKGIAKENRLSHRTVEFILAKLRREFKCKTTTHLVATFLRNELIK